jgi:ABC-type uncharacterized transport system substrate-binding protein
MKIILFLLFLINTILAFTISLPSDTTAPTYEMVLKELQKRNIKFQTKKINFKNYKENISKIKSDIEQSDVLFVTGGYLDITTKFIKPTIPIVFLGVQNAQKIDLENAKGVFRTTNIAKILEKSAEIVPSNSKPMGILYKKDSSLSNLIPKFMQISKKNNLNVISLEYETLKDIESIFQQNRVSSILLFPPSVNKKLIPNIVNMQNRYKIPVITQLKRDIKNGILGGIVIDYYKIIPTLADLIINIKNGLTPKELHNYYFSNKYVLNLYAINNLKINLDKDIIKKSKIINISHNKSDIQDIKKGFYKIAISHHTVKNIQEYYLRKLKEMGYIVDKNLQVLYFDTKAPKDVDFIFSSGGKLEEIINNNPNHKILFIGTKDVVNKIKLNPKLHFGVFRSSTPKMFERVLNFNNEFKKIAILIQKDEKQIIKKLDIKNINRLKFVIKLYDSKSNLENIFQELKKDKFDAIFTLPLSIKPEDKKEVINLQFKYKIPLIASLQSEVQAGFAIGVVIDFDKYQMQLAQIADNVFQKRVTPQHFYYASEFYYINLNTINRLNVKLNRNSLKNAKIYMENK